MAQRITIQYPPTATKTGGAYFKDEDGVLNFGDSSLLTLQQRDVIEAERTHNPPKGKFNASFTINSWKPAAPAQSGEPPKQFTRPRTDPHDQLQIFLSVMMKSWNEEYCRNLTDHVSRAMRLVNAAEVVQAMEAYTVAYRRYHGDRLQSGADIQEPPREDMNDAIPEWARQR